MSEFAGRRYIVTGASSGIGQEVARTLTDRGAAVYAMDRNEPAVTVENYVPVDLADVLSIDRAIEQLDGEFSGLINVAGVPGTAPAPVILAVNALAVRHLTESLLDRIIPGGSIVVVSSTAGFGWPDRIKTILELLATDTFEEGAEWFAAHPQKGNPYNFSKEVATVYAMTMGLALGEMDLRINAVLPGPVETPILRDFEQTMGKETLDAVKELIGRHASPSEIADVVLFLASDASRWVNGHALIADGGASGPVLTGLVSVPEV